ncbi:MAG: hypothetical protein JWP63_5885 [Candidatus Solibacter sp.]|nr:hypothetical protein [Candidatus Solibacter sp.]
MIALATAIAFAGGLTARIVNDPNREIGVCLERSTQELIEASLGVSRLFKSINVNVKWLDPLACKDTPGVIYIVLCYDSPKDQDPRSLGYALPYDGTRIVILMDHLRASARFGPERNRLTYVLVHEITHLLQGISRHSQTGIMKAHWTRSDQYDISMGTLRFATEDMELIHYGMAARLAKARAQTAVY